MIVKMTKKNKSRLLKIVRHAEKGILGHKVFDFSTVNDHTPNKCGTNGCLIGEMPIIFPKEWYFGEEGYPRLFNDDDFGISERMRYFLGIDYSAINHLFFPNHQLTDLFNGEILGRNATRYEVAKNIREFLKLVEVEG